MLKIPTLFRFSKLSKAVKKLHRLRQAENDSRNLPSVLNVSKRKQNFENYLKNRKNEIARNSELREKSPRKSKSASTKVTQVLFLMLLLTV